MFHGPENTLRKRLRLPPRNLPPAPCHRAPFLPPEHLPAGPGERFFLLSSLQARPLHTLDPQSPFRWSPFRSGSEAIHPPMPSPVRSPAGFEANHGINGPGRSWVDPICPPPPGDEHRQILPRIVRTRIPFILRRLCLIVMHLSDPGTASCTKHLTPPPQLETVSRGRGLHCSMTVTIPGGEGRRSFLTGRPVFSRRPAREKIHLD